MPNQHKNPDGIFWRSSDPTLKPWIENEASTRGVTLREYLDEVLAAHRSRSVPLQTPETPQAGEKK